MCGALLECRDCEDEGAGCSVAGTLEHLVGGGGAGGLLPGASPAPHPQHPPNMLQPMEEMILPPKRQAVVDRLRRRIETYRRRQSECVPRFDQSFTGACEQQNLETTALQKRFLEGKAKRQVKKTERKPDLPAISGNLHSSVVHVQQKFGCGDYEPPAKLHCGSGAGGGVGGEALTKFSVEIVQQLEFTTSAADSQPQQISTNVTVKALANAVKTSNSPPPQQPPPRAPTPLDIDRECKAECKSEVADDEYGLDECAAALERDSAFPGLAELIGEDDGDDTFEDLITEISEYPELIDFDLDGGKMNGGNVGLDSSDGDCGSRGYGGSGEMSPAAHTLKQMAEQHQQAAGDWRYRGYGPYRPRAPPPPQPQPCHPTDHLHLSQHQQLHLSQPHHTLQVSAAQHMQVSGSGAGHVSVAAQQGMYANFQHQGTPSPQHHQGGNGCDTYTMSQSQSINFSQTMRARPAAPQASAPGPGQTPLGVAAAGISREQQAKMLQQQQQQMLRAQQQMRPPPPEYKARFVGAVGGVGSVGNVGGVPMGARRPAGPAPRPFAPHARQYAPEWRHVLMQQQQQQATRQQFPHHHQGFSLGGMGGGMSQQQQMQLQQARMQQQQQQLMQQHQQQHQQRTSSQQQPSMSQLIMQQNQMMNVQGHMPNIHMSQSQSMSMGGMGGMGGGHQGSPMQAQGGPMHPQNASMQSMLPQSQTGPMQSQNSSGHSFPSLHSSSFGHTADFNLDFLDNLPSTEASNLTAQELLNSLDNSFLNDIL